MVLEFTLKGKVLHIAKRGMPPFTSGIVYNRRHKVAVEDRFRAWAKQGWPYEPKG
ncbi:hypothetical protein vBPFY1MI_90 [Pseudomonas phage vB_PF_Y1-MI]|nr:hypothetical protein vBPFY1MI_90 [Pseudomonas phage vB_PF_Y1-MI]